MRTGMKWSKSFHVKIGELFGCKEFLTYKYISGNVPNKVEIHQELISLKILDDFQKKEN